MMKPGKDVDTILVYINPKTASMPRSTYTKILLDRVTATSQLSASRPEQ